MVLNEDPVDSTLHTPTFDNNDNNSDEFDMVESQQALLRKANNHCHENGESGATERKRFRNFSGKHCQGGDRAEFLEVDEKMCENSIAPDGISKTRKYFAVLVLFFINLLNYMDRFTIAGVLLSIQQYFNVGNASAGLLQTVFIISYMLFAPLFGFLGDRYNRKIVMLVGMFIWSGATLFASFIEDKSHFILFLALRGLVGIGEASYSTIAPTIIADLFVKTERTRMLSAYFIAIPVGSGLGYVVGAAAAKAAGSWHWALRVTPGLGLIAMGLLMLVIPNPRRGGLEVAAEVVAQKDIDKNTSSYIEDLKYILKNKSFMFLTVGFTFMAFVVGSLTIWGPVYLAYSQIVIGVLEPCTDDGCEYASVSFMFGVITCVAGFLGVWIGAESAKKLKERGFKNADAQVCAFALVLAAPLMFFGFELAVVAYAAALVFIFLANLSLCLTWTLLSDMTLYVTMPNRRSTAQAVQILTMHLFGDAGSPYLLGVMSDALLVEMPNTYYSRFISLKLSIYMTLFASVLGGGCFLFASLFLQRDKRKVDDYLSGKTPNSKASSSPAGESDQSLELTKMNSIGMRLAGDGDAPFVEEKLLDERTLPDIEFRRTNYLSNSVASEYDAPIDQDLVHQVLLFDSKESDI